MANPILIDCPKCAGDMGSRRVPRMGGALAFLGTILLGSAVLVILTALPMLAMGSAFDEVFEGLPDIEHEIAVDELREIDELPYSVLEEFRRERDVSSESLARLPEDVRSEVETVLSDYREYDLESVADSFPSERMDVLGRIMLIFGVPTALVGFFLARKRKIWLCLDCGHEQPQ